MATYAMLPMRAGTASGFGGGISGLIGSIGPAWNESFNQTMQTANRWYDLQNRVALDQYAVPAQAATYDNQLQQQAASAVVNDAKKDVVQWLAQTEQQALSDQVLQALGVQGNGQYPQQQVMVTPEQQQLQYAQTQAQSPAAYGPMTTQYNIHQRLGGGIPMGATLGTARY